MNLFKSNYKVKGGLYGNIFSGPLVTLLAANTIVFVLLKILYFVVSPQVLGNIVSYLAMPLNFGEFITKPWIVLTYMFVHEGFFHFLFNMLILIVFGNMFKAFAGDRNLMLIYLSGGILGAIFAMIFRYLPIASTVLENSILLGASAGVMSIVIAATFFMPDQVVRLYYIFPVKLKYLGLGMIALDILSILFLSNAGGHISHLGGALAGYLFITSFKNGNVFVVTREHSVQAKRVVERVEIKNAYKRPLSDDEFNEIKISNRERLDLILDKINHSGINSLSKFEKDFLNKYSKEI
jgi:membrane associated rhomboid family serine protease